MLSLLLAAALSAGPISLDPSVRFEFTDCAVGGSAAQTLTKNTQYLMRVTGEDTFVCFAVSGSTCAANGEKFPAPFAALVYITDNLKSVSCRSTGSTGDVIFTKVD
jgi:hypothetical protein